MAYHINTSSLLPRYHTSDPVTILHLPLTQYCSNIVSIGRRKTLHGYSTRMICLQNHSISIKACCTPLNASIPLSLTPSVTVQLLSHCSPPSIVCFSTTSFLPPHHFTMLPTLHIKILHQVCTCVGKFNVRCNEVPHTDTHTHT